MRSLLSLLPLLLLGTVAWPQANTPPPPANTPASPSPAVQPDGTVIFRLSAPNATTLSLVGDYPISPGYQASKKSVPMTRDENGVWSATVGPLKPDFYSYHFLLDGVSTLDPANIRVNRDGAQYANWAIVPGTQTTNYMINQVPHGEVGAEWYTSTTLNMSRRMTVYTPPGYQSGSARYPVLYLLHGGGGDEQAWSDMGRAPEIFDNLIAQGRMTPFLVVMINCNWWEATSPNDSPARTSDSGPGIERTPEEIIRDIVPFVDKTYRTKADRDDRAIAGLSRGGAQTLLTALNHLDEFSWVGVFSGGLPLLPNVLVNIPMPSDAATRRGPDVGHSIDPVKFAQLFPQLGPQVNSRLHLFYLTIGDHDGLIESWQTARKVFDEKGVKYTWIEVPGYGHEWSFWRLALSDFAPRLFKSTK